MHLLIPFASGLSEAANQVLCDLSLPRLARLLTRLTPTERDEGDEYSFTPPHERALAAAWGWHGTDGVWPWAAHAAARDGIEVGQQPWGLITPAHWHVGRDHVTLADPAALHLDAEESRALFEAVRHLFESEGFALTWGGALRWYAAHESLAALPCAALDRVIGRNVELWMRGDTTTHPRIRLIRRLQSELQLLLYPHPINEAREARGELAVNSFWLSGCGRHQPADESAVTVNQSLRAPMLAQDWAAWAEAWRALDGGDLAALLTRAEAGKPATLTLCGERSAQRLANTRQSPWKRLARRWQGIEPHTALEAL